MLTGAALSLPTEGEIARRLQEQFPARGLCEGCKYVLPRMEIHVRGDQWFLASPFHVPPGIGPGTLRKRLKAVFVCPKHLRVHHCSPNCPCVLNQDRCLMCPRTGLIWDASTEITRSWRTSSRTEASQSMDKSDPLRHHRDTGGRVRSLSAHNVKDAGYLKIALRCLRHLFFSKERILHEVSTFDLARKSAMKKVTRYARKCVRENKPRNMALMQRIFSNECGERGRYLHRIARVQEHHLFLQSLALDAVKVFRELSERKLSLPFEHFVVACVYLIRRGLVDIPRRPSLHLLLPPANCLHRFFPELPFTQSKNAITKIMRQ